MIDKDLKELKPIFEEIDPKIAGDYKLVMLNERENCFKTIFSYLKELNIKPNYSGDIEYFFSFISRSDKRQLLDKGVYELKIIQNPLTNEIKIEHATCPDYNLNRMCESDCSHITFAKKIMELYK